MRSLAWIYAIQPRSIQLGLGKGLGWILYRLQFRVRIAHENLSRAFPDQSEKQKFILRESYTHLGRLVLEIFLLLAPSRKHPAFARFVQQWMTLEGAQNIQQAQARGKGIIFLASHLGNWEMMAAGGALLAHLDLMMVTKKLKPDWLHRAIEKNRLACGVKATYEPRTLKDVLHHLKKGGAVGIVSDQYLGPPVGIRVPVFGTPVGTSMLIATLSKRTGAAVLPVVNYREKNGRYVLKVYPALDWQEAEDPHYELAINTADYSQRLEKSIYEYPEQWLWTHRRFKGDLSPLKPDEWIKPRVRQ